MDLKLSWEQAALGVSVIAVSGEIDIYTAPELRERLARLLQGGPYHLVLDLEGVEFLDSTGLGALLSALKRVRAHDGSIDIVCTQSRILRIFKITSLDRVFPIYDSIRDALGARSNDNGQPASGGIVKEDLPGPPR